MVESGRIERYAAPGNERVLGSLKRSPGVSANQKHRVGPDGDGSVPGEIDARRDARREVKGPTRRLSDKAAYHLNIERGGILVADLNRTVRRFASEVEAVWTVNEAVRGEGRPVQPFDDPELSRGAGVLGSRAPGEGHAEEK
jgi:hypothetical protein